MSTVIHTTVESAMIFTIVRFDWMFIDQLIPSTWNIHSSEDCFLWKEKIDRVFVISPTSVFVTDISNNAMGIYTHTNTQMYMSFISTHNNFGAASSNLQATSCQYFQTILSNHINYQKAKKICVIQRKKWLSSKVNFQFLICVFLFQLKLFHTN